MSEISARDSNIIFASNNLAIEFKKIGDRYLTNLLLGKDSIVKSVEGDSSEIWPPSPPFQELCIENRGENGQVALLVGMAGKSHWSAAIESTDRGGFEFDVACRFGSASGARNARLESSYRIEEKFRKKPDSQNNILVFESESHRTEFAPITGGQWTFDSKSQIASFQVATSEEKTRRWKYEVAVMEH